MHYLLVNESSCCGYSDIIALLETRELAEIRLQKYLQEEKDELTLYYKNRSISVNIDSYISSHCRLGIIEIELEK